MRAGCGGPSPQGKARALALVDRVSAAAEFDVGSRELDNVDGDCSLGARAGKRARRGARRMRLRLRF